MSFEENLIDQFISFGLKPPEELPKDLHKLSVPKHLTHLYADYVELIALFSNGSHITRDGLLDRLQDEGVLRLEDSKETLNEVGSDTAEQQDNQEAWIGSIFKILEERANLFSDNYLFNYSNNNLILKDYLSFKQELYLMLLIASNLNLFHKVQSKLTAEFELISFYVLKSFLPASAIIKSFGENTEYAGNTKAKISALSKDLNLEINEYELGQISDGNVKDRGLDVIGWIPFTDKNPNFLTLLGQCACGKDWFKKSSETKRYQSYLRFYKLHPIHCLFIPYSIIEVSKGFYQSDEIHNSLMFERKRIVELFEEEEIFNSLNSRKIVTKAIEFEEGIV